MLGSFWNLVSDNPIELYTAVIATVGVACWYVDRRSMKTALNAARNHELVALRLKSQESKTRVERSLAVLQTKSELARNHWQNHRLRNGPLLGSGFHVSEEDKQISYAVRTGGQLFNKLNATMPEPHCFEVAKFELYISAADRTSIQIDNLAAQLPDPQLLHH
ncbi:hypothetical protein [Ascidiaceihabitans sp.]